MSTDWVTVIVSLLFCGSIGVGLIRFAEPLSKFQAGQARAFGWSDSAARRFAPGPLRVMGFAFIVFGLIGALMGLFFADKM